MIELMHGDCLELNDGYFKIAQDRIRREFDGDVSK